MERSSSPALQDKGTKLKLVDPLFLLKQNVEETIHDYIRCIKRLINVNWGTKIENEKFNESVH